MDHDVKIMDAMEAHMQLTLGAIDNLGVCYTSYARTFESIIKNTGTSQIKLWPRLDDIGV